MALTASQPPHSGTEILPAEMTVVNWPLRDRPLETSLMLLVALGAAVFAGRVTGIGWWTPTFSLALAAASWRMWIPVTSRIDHRGIEQICARRRRLIPWSAIAWCRHHPRGVMLFARVDDIPLANLRGLYVDGGDQTVELWRTVDFYVQPRKDSSGTTISFYE